MNDNEQAPCLDGILSHPLPGLDDPEGDLVPSDLPRVVDSHVHLFPDAIFDRIWQWFDRWGWPIRYPLYTPQVIQFQLDRGVSHIIALHYSHRPGIARSMNAYMAQIAAEHPQVTGLGTVFPGEPEAPKIIAEAFSQGLAGIKLHCHVQCFAPDIDEMEEIYEACVAHDRPLVMHAGREPKSPGYKCDPHELCSADRVERALLNHPKLRLCVPHLGADEFDAYADLLERFDNLWLDTTMMLADYFPGEKPPKMWQIRPDRILYGTDFPSIPYAWDRELIRLRGWLDDDAALEGVVGANALALFSTASLE